MVISMFIIFIFLIFLICFYVDYKKDQRELKLREIELQKDIDNFVFINEKIPKSRIEVIIPTEPFPLYTDYFGYKVRKGYWMYPTEFLTSKKCAEIEMGLWFKNGFVTIENKNYPMCNVSKITIVE